MHMLFLCLSNEKLLGFQAAERRGAQAPPTFDPLSAGRAQGLLAPGWRFAPTEQAASYVLLLKGVE